MTNEELVQAIQNGEQEKMEQLWIQTERFVCKEAQCRIMRTGGLGGTTFDDLHQSGYLALVTATKSYNSKAGMSFIGWLSLCLKTAFSEAEGQRTQRQQQDPLHQALSLNRPVSADDNCSETIGDRVPAPDSSLPFENVENRIKNEQLRQILEKALDMLPPQQSTTIRYRYFLSCSLTQTGASLGVSGERSRQLEEMGLQSIREAEIGRQLEAFVDFNTTYYLKVSAKRFNTTQTSATEEVVLIRERLREHLMCERK